MQTEDLVVTLRLVREAMESGFFIAGETSQVRPNLFYRHSPSICFVSPWGEKWPKYSIQWHEKREEKTAPGLTN